MVRAVQKVRKVWQVRNQKAELEMSLRSRSSAATCRGKSSKRFLLNKGTPLLCVEKGALRWADMIADAVTPRADGRLPLFKALSHQGY